MALSNMQSLKMTGTNNPFYGKNHTQDTRDKIREWNKSRGYVGENHPWFGCKHTDTEKEKMRKNDQIVLVEIIIMLNMSYV